MVAMDCVPELAVTNRETVSTTKMAKRLRRFVRDNQPPDAPPSEYNSDDNGTHAFARSCGKPGGSVGELLCRIPEETLFQLQQIYEALEESVAGAGGSGYGGNRRKSTSSVSSLTTLVASPSPSGDVMEDEQQSGPSYSNGAVVRTPEKASKKRGRGEDEPATASKVEEASPKQKKKKKARRKSNAT